MQKKSKNIIVFLTISICLLFGFSVKASTLTLNDSPYYFLNDTTITGALIIEAGVVVNIGEMVKVRLEGDLIINGTANDPVTFNPTHSDGWEIFLVHAYTGRVNIKHAIMNEGRFEFRVKAVRIDNVVYNSNQNLAWNGAFTRIKLDNYDSLHISNCELNGINKGEGFLIHNAVNPIVENCIFDKVPDAVEFIDCIGGIITNSKFTDNNDDAIDLNNCENTEISYNTISGVSNRGLEIGSENFGNSVGIHVFKNIIFNCSIGISFKENSDGLVENNTLYNNDLAISSLEDKVDFGGSTINVLSTLLNENVEDFEVDGVSFVNFNYCMTDNAPLLGSNNLTGSAEFVDALGDDFHLTAISPCIDKGSPLSLIDTNNTNADIGALPYYLLVNGNYVEGVSNLSIYPNPTQGMVTFELGKFYEDVTLEIFDTGGRLINKQEGSGLAFHFNMSDSKFKEGIYFVKITGEEFGIHSSKIVKY
tara:strand:- start:650 stop:2080 length:1431 start_codon:yes stop_codon:yes gene_type:complete